MKVSLRRFLIMKAMARAGADWFSTVDAVDYAESVSSWDFNQEETWETWESITGMKRVPKTRRAA